MIYKTHEWTERECEQLVRESSFRATLTDIKWSDGGLEFTCVDKLRPRPGDMIYHDATSNVFAVHAMKDDRYVASLWTKNPIPGPPTADVFYVSRPLPMHTFEQLCKDDEEFYGPQND